MKQILKVRRQSWHAAYAGHEITLHVTRHCLQNVNACGTLWNKAEFSRKDCKGRAFSLSSKMKLIFLRHIKAVLKAYKRCPRYKPSRQRRVAGVIALLILDLGVGGTGLPAPRPGRFTPGEETRYPLYRRLGGSRGPYGWVRKIPPPPGLDSRPIRS
jgi:hypothetical protein